MMMNSTSIVHLLSGGLDSVVMLHDLHGQGCKIHCALFDYKQRHAQELIWAKHHCGALGVMFTTFEIPQLRGSELTDGSGGVIVPNRNAILLSMAVNLAVSCRAELVTFAANKDDEAMFPDCRHEFVNAFNEMLRSAGIEVQVCAPYLDETKARIAAIGHEMGVELSETWSCYRGGVKPCGKCEACNKREAALCGL
jgi:7-cyano-7-deazaguanine synthase